jgi:hypothetical protein
LGQLGNFYNEKLLSACPSPLITLVEIGETCGTFGTKRNADIVLVGKCAKEIKVESYRRLEDGGNAEREEV